MRRTLLLLTALGTATLAPAPVRAQDAKPPAGQAAPAAPAAGAKRTPEQLETELQQAGGELRKAMSDPEVLTDPAKRKAAAPQVVPLMKRMVATLDEVVVLQPQARDSINEARLEFVTILTLFGDADARAALDKMAGGEGTAAVEARCGQQVVTYLTNPKDEAAQLKVLDEMRKIAQANPKEDAIGQTLLKMANMGAASKAVSEKAEDIIIGDLTGDYAREVGQRIGGQRKLQQAYNKPIEFAGTRPDGTAFNTKDWRGKVVLVDFWATWCPPCIEGLPKLKKLYIDHHAKGLEILGISSDAEPQVLKDFLGKNKDMPWPQIVDPKPNVEDPLHPLARQWGLRLPTLMLIDRKGVLRSIDAEPHLDELIPQLLAEKAE